MDSQITVTVEGNESPGIEAITRLMRDMDFLARKIPGLLLDRYSGEIVASAVSLQFAGPTGFAFSLSSNPHRSLSEEVRRDIDDRLMRAFVLVFSSYERNGHSLENDGLQRELFGLVEEPQLTMLDDRRRTIDMAALEQLLERFFGRQYQLMCSHRVCVAYADMSIVLTRLSTAQAALNPVLNPKGRQRKREEQIDLTLVCHCPIRNGLWLCEEDGDYVQALIAEDELFCAYPHPVVGARLSVKAIDISSGSKDMYMQTYRVVEVLDSSPPKLSPP